MIDDFTLYLDNFRGFKDTYVSLLDVNFLVGENSSGKTSFLSLLKLMGGNRLLIGNEFTDEDVNLGPFQDIVSAHAENPKNFRIGMIRNNHTPTGTMPMGVLIMYEKQEGLPIDTCLTCTFEDKEISVRRKGRDAYYRVRAGAIDSFTKMKDLFPIWINEQQKMGSDFKKFDFRFEPESSLLFPLSAIAQPSLRDHVPMLSPHLFEPLVWIAPVRSKPRRTYDEPTRSFSSEGGHIPYLIRKILASRSEAKKFSKMINEVGKASGLFQSLAIKRLGLAETDPFEVHIVLAGCGKKQIPA